MHIIINIFTSKVFFDNLLKTIKTNKKRQRNLPMPRSQNLTNPKNLAKYNPMINIQGKADISTVNAPLADGGNPFKDSVVQDVVYHGTEWDFYDEFKPDVIGLIHFGTKKAAFDRNPLVVKRAYISLKNPLRVEDAGDHWDGHHLIRVWLFSNIEKTL
jgi:hypothetical protein